MAIRAANTLAEARRVGSLAGTAEVVPDWGAVFARIRDEATDDWDDTRRGRAPGEGRSALRAGPRRDSSGAGVVEVTARGTPPSRGVVLNTGTRPAAPPVDGLADTPFWTNRDVLATRHLPASMVVIGGGAIGVELAQAFARFGTRVSLVEAAPRILAPEEPEASEVVARALAADGIQVLAGASIDSVRHAEGRFTLSLTDAGGTGLELGGRPGPRRRRASAQHHGRRAGHGRPRPARRSIDTDERMRAGERLWAIGDITGQGAFTHMSMYQADVALRDILGRGRRARGPSTMPCRA